MTTRITPISATKAVNADAVPTVKLDPQAYALYAAAAKAYKSADADAKADALEKLVDAARFMIVPALERLVTRLAKPSKFSPRPAGADPFTTASQVSISDPKPLAAKPPAAEAAVSRDAPSTFKNFFSWSTTDKTVSSHGAQLDVQSADVDAGASMGWSYYKVGPVGHYVPDVASTTADVSLSFSGSFSFPQGFDIDVPLGDTCCTTCATSAECCDGCCHTCCQVEGACCACCCVPGEGCCLPPMGSCKGCTHPNIKVVPKTVGMSSLQLNLSLPADSLLGSGIVELSIMVPSNPGVSVDAGLGEGCAGVVCTPVNCCLNLACLPRILDVVNKKLTGATFEVKFALPTAV